MFLLSSVKLQAGRGHTVAGGGGGGGSLDPGYMLREVSSFSFFTRWTREVTEK
jgi:hypothetical protein